MVQVMRKNRNRISSWRSVIQGYTKPLQICSVFSGNFLWEFFPEVGEEVGEEGRKSGIVAWQPRFLPSLFEGVWCSGNFSAHTPGADGGATTYRGTWRDSGRLALRPAGDGNRLLNE
jgi:hypothetical protein